MGLKVFATGLAIILALPAITPVANSALIGAIVTIIGVILMWLDK